MMRSVICPVSSEKVNENAVRITGFITAVLMAAYISTGNIYFVWFLALDFYIRAFTSLKYSIASRTAVSVSRAFHMPEIKISKAPKVFAARVGFLFSLAIGSLYNLQMQGSSTVFGLVLIAFALLEALFNICIGCQVYTYIILPLYKMNTRTTIK